MSPTIFLWMSMRSILGWHGSEEIGSNVECLGEEGLDVGNGNFPLRELLWESDNLSRQVYF